MPPTTLKPQKIKNKNDHESVSAIAGKVKADIAGVTGFRRYISLRRLIRCGDCDGIGILSCAGCGGAGEQKMVWNDEVSKCEPCAGTGEVTCDECMGRKFVKNPYRKFVVWAAVAGCLGWSWVIFSIWGSSLFPEEQSKLIHGGGNGGAPTVTIRKNNPTRNSGGRRGVGIAPGGGSRTPPPTSGDETR